MKHLFRGLLFVAVIPCCNSRQALAQQMPPIPIDRNVRIGKLDNGLTYYIRKDNLPANHVDLYIAQKVDSIQEEENQRGLAHFLEHMCFSGTIHLPDDTPKQYLERIRVKFGENLNAYTTIDEAVYNISSIPVNTPGAVDSCLLILHDWNNDLALDPEEIDKERGAINGERRIRMSTMMRMQEKLLLMMHPDDKYTNSFPIGTMDVMMNFKPQTLGDYYGKWYHPGLQGIVIVGDIDIGAVETKIRTVLTDILAQLNATERIYYPVADNKEPIICILKDRGQPHVQIPLLNKHEAIPDNQKGNVSYLMQQYARDLISNMLSVRLDESARTANPFYIHAGVQGGSFFIAKTKDAFLGIAIYKEDSIDDDIAILLRKIERARQFGSTETGYNRARAEYLRQLEPIYNERDKQKNDKHINEYVRHFLDNEPIPDVENEYTFTNQIAPSTPVAAIN